MILLNPSSHFSSVLTRAHALLRISPVWRVLSTYRMESILVGLPGDSQGLEGNGEGSWKSCIQSFWRSSYRYWSSDPYEFWEKSFPEWIEHLVSILSMAIPFLDRKILYSNLIPVFSEKLSVQSVEENDPKKRILVIRKNRKQTTVVGQNNCSEIWQIVHIPLAPRRKWRQFRTGTRTKKTRQKEKFGVGFVTTNSILVTSDLLFIPWDG